MKLALQLLSFHRTNTLEPLLRSLEAQTNKDWVLYWQDNASTPDELLTMKKIVEAVRPSFDIIWFDSAENMGFDGGHERLYHEHNAEYILCVNDDVILEPAYIATLRQYVDDHHDVGAVEGMVLRWHFGPHRQTIEKTRVVDSLGLQKTRFHKVYDIDSGKVLIDPPEEPTGVWGVSGCLPMYRRAALREQLFDPAYFMYKEDVDAAYRLNKTGWKSVMVPGAVAYHLRTFQSSLLHQGVSYRSQILSYRNHWRNLKKHLTWKDWLKDGWAILPFEGAKAIFILGKAIYHHFL